MNKTVELVNEWAKFEEKYPNGAIEDFCRYYLIGKRVGEVNESRLSGKALAIEKPILLMRTMGRIVRLFMMYAENAKDKTKLKQFEDFNLMNTISHLGDPKKTEAIYESMTELSTGIDILNRLKDMEYIEEKDDPADKRSKRVSLTDKGREVLHGCYDVFGRVNVMLLKDVAREDIILCILLLKGVEEKFSRLWLQHKGKDFEEVYAEIMGEKE